MGAMDGFVATGGPASAAVEEIIVVAPADEDFTGRSLLLEVALEAEIGIAHFQHLFVDRAMRRVATGAAFANGFVFESEGALLC